MKPSGLIISVMFIDILELGWVTSRRTLAMTSMEWDTSLDISGPLYVCHLLVSVLHLLVVWCIAVLQCLGNQALGMSMYELRNPY